MRFPRPTYANVVSTMALILVVSAGTIALAAGEDIHACIKKPGTTNPGLTRIVPAGTTCNANEDPIMWAQEGPEGPAGSPDTPEQVLSKIKQVDGDGSGLDSSYLDGLNSTAFLRNNAKAVDADKLDGISSGSFVRRGTASGGTIGLSAIGAHKCADVTLGIGGLKVGDVFVLNVREGDAFPARLTYTVLDVPEDGKVRVRICNPTAAASVADNDIKLRWYALRP